MRGSIVHYCEKHPKECVSSSYGLNGTRFSFKVDGHNPLSLSQQSVFCFQPIGDLMTRKGLFDSILLGCIPVVFDPLTAHVMYTWHWEEEFWKEIMVEFPFHPTAHRYFDPVQALIDMYEKNRSLVTKKQELIRSRVFELQYSLDGPNDIYQYDSKLQYVSLVQVKVSENTTEGESKLPSPPEGYRFDGLVDNQYSYKTKIGHGIEKISNAMWPRNSKGDLMKDAFDIVIDLMLGWHSGEKTRFRNATVPECWDGVLNQKLNKCVPK